MMTKIPNLARAFVAAVTLLTFQYGFSCSAYKVTAGGKTMVGSNYDTWLETPRIWFETNDYGCAFTGARRDGAFGFAPQTGLNEHGLAFVTLATATPKSGKPSPDKKQIASRTNYLKDILHLCKTVDEAKAYIDQYDHSTLRQDVFLYVDSTGKYLVVEPYLTTLGADEKYVQANFCPSTVEDLSTIQQVRYRNGVAFLKDKIDASIDFCTALSDTMHVCREKHGDGTLLTSILDLNEGVYHLYFYHDYKHQVKFDVKDELAKGNHFMEIAPLFPPNAEFKKLRDFKTPANTPALDMFLRFCVWLFSVSALFFFISFFIKRSTTKYSFAKAVMAILSVLLLYYTFVLATVENVFFFPAPYTDGSLSMVSISSYIPFLLLVLIVPLIAINIKLFRENAWGVFAKWLFTLNNIVYVVLIFLYAYWGLYNVFS